MKGGGRSAAKRLAIIPFIGPLRFDGRFPSDCHWDPRKRPRSSPALRDTQGLRHSELPPRTMISASRSTSLGLSAQKAIRHSLATCRDDSVTPKNSVALSAPAASNWSQYVACEPQRRQKCLVEGPHLRQTYRLRINPASPPDEEWGPFYFFRLAWSIAV